MMNALRLQFPCKIHSHLTNPFTNAPPIVPIIPKCKPSVVPSSSTSPNSRRNPSKPILQESPKYRKSDLFSTGKSRALIIGALSLGVAAFLMGFDDHKALALGPEGPLMEEFWDNMRRYALYVVTVSTGAIYTLLQPIVELLKNPISAVLILVILGGGFYLVSQVVTAMVGLSDFSYEYTY